MKRFFDAKEVKDRFGYDLYKMANQGGFPSLEASVSSWCDEACETIDNLLSDCWSKEYLDIIYEETEGSFYKVIKEAQLQQMRFIIEHGNLEQIGKKNSEFYEVDKRARKLLENASLLTYF